MINDYQMGTYNDVLDKLMDAKNPELMLRELIAERGTPFITEDMIFLIEMREGKEDARMNNILLANPELELSNFPSYHKRKDRLTLIQELFEKIGTETLDMIGRRKPSLEKDSPYKKENPTIPKPKGRIKTIHHVLAYYFNCSVMGKSLPEASEKTKLEGIWAEKKARKPDDPDYKWAPNSFYKNYCKITVNDLNSKKALNEKAGKNWGEIVIYLSEYPDEVRNYLKDKKLI